MTVDPTIEDDTLIDLTTDSSDDEELIVLTRETIHFDSVEAEFVSSNRL